VREITLRFSDFSDEEIERVLLPIADQFEKKYKEFEAGTDSEDYLKVILKGHLYIEQELNLLLNKNLKYPQHLDKRMDFMTKVSLVFALGAVDELEKNVIVNINKIRNKYAHQINFELTDEYFQEKIYNAFSPTTRQTFTNFLSSFKHDAEKLIRRLKVALFTVWYMLVDKTLIPDEVKQKLSKINGVTRSETLPQIKD
jgi:hypothetical protein